MVQLALLLMFWYGKNKVLINLEERVAKSRYPGNRILDIYERKSGDLQIVAINF